MDDDLTTYQNTSKKNYWLMLGVIGVLFLLVIICALTYKVLSQRYESNEPIVPTVTESPSPTISATATPVLSPTPDVWNEYSQKWIQGITDLREGKRSFSGEYSSWGGGGSNIMSFNFDSKTQILTAEVLENDWAQGEYPEGASGNDNPPFEGRKYKYEKGNVYRMENGEYELGDYVLSTGEPDFGFEDLAEDIMQRLVFDLTQSGKILKMNDESFGELFYFVEHNPRRLEEDEELPFYSNIDNTIRLTTAVNEECAQSLLKYTPCENVTDMYLSTRHNWFFNAEGGLVGYSIDSDDAHIVIEYN